jgi:hypothetical protein
MTNEQIRQNKIDEAIKNKEKRLDQTSLSILISWAINNATQTLTEKDKADWQTKIAERYQYFIDLYREWMLENASIDWEKVESTRKWQADYDAASKAEEVNAELSAE